jgi:uncharacterized repeat protein (TIGR03803 family)
MPVNLPNALPRSLVLATCAAAIAPAAHAATFTTLAAIKAGYDGAAARSAPIKVGNSLYGTTVTGGKYFSGTVFKQDPATGKTTTIYSFTGGADGNGPNGVLSLGGMLYGTTIAGGTGANGGNGSIFEVDPSTGQETTLYDFPGGKNGAAPFGNLANVGGVLFGITQIDGAYNAGTLFSFDLATGTETLVHTFGAGNDGSSPHSGLIRSGQLLYGTTYYGGNQGGWGTVYSVDPQTGAVNLVHSFNRTDGYFPSAGLIASGKTLYGTTSQYGADLPGEVFAVDKNTGAETTLYQFTGGADGGDPSAAPTLVSGTLYGTTSSGTGNATNGTIYAIDIATGTEKTVYAFGANSGTPAYAGLLDVNGVLYGATADGGLAGAGALYDFNPITNELTITHSFTGFSPGYYANPGLTASGGRVYAVTPQGGSENLGAVLKIDPATATVKTLASFTGGGQGFAPAAPLLSAQGSLYGTTSAGDPESGTTGTVFQLDPASGTITTLFRFGTGTQAASPDGALIDVNGSLWGPNGYAPGTVFKTNPGNGKTITVHTFGGQDDGWTPQGPLVEVNGTLYGTTLYECCGDGAGTIYQIDPKHKTETVVHNFGEGTPIALNPSGGLEKVGKTLYGALINSFNGGPGGTIFALDPKSAQVTAVYNFTGGSDGAAPMAPPIALNGMLYGTASQGGTGFGTIYALDPATGSETTLYTFTGGADGGSPQGKLINVGGTLYGTTSQGAADNRGTVFSLTP